MKNLIFVCLLMPLAAFSGTLESSANSQSLSLVSDVAHACPEQLNYIIRTRMRILGLTAAENSQSKVYEMKAGVLGNPVTGIDPEAVLMLTVRQGPRKQPVGMDGAVSRDGTCELINLRSGQKIQMGNE